MVDIAPDRRSAPPTRAARVPGRKPGTRRARWAGWLFVAPALVMYGVFVLRPLALTFQYSLYQLGRHRARYLGRPEQLREGVQRPDPGEHHPQRVPLIVFFSAIPVLLGLAIASVIRRIAVSRLATVARTVLFLPQVIPLVAAGIAWSWLLSSTGVDQPAPVRCRPGGVTRAWLGNFSTALPAVGLIGAWVLLGLCTVLLLAGMTKIDPGLYEAARIDGAGSWREFISITLPGLRQEIAVCVTVTVIAALASFDIIYISTQGGPGDTTMVPGPGDLRAGVLRPPGRTGVGAGRRPDGPRARLRAADPVAGQEGCRVIAGRREVITGQRAARPADGLHACCRS